MASRTPCQGSMGTGFRNLSGPIGGLANGIPVKICTSLPITVLAYPLTSPLFVSTTSGSLWKFFGVDVVVGVVCVVDVVVS